MVLPLGTQDGGHTTYTCPSGTWMERSVAGYLNGVALPDEWLLNRSDTSIQLGGGMPLTMWPDTTIAQRRELRVSYDALLVDASGEITASGFMSRHITRTDFLATQAEYDPFNVMTSVALETEVDMDDAFHYPEDSADFSQSAEVEFYLNGARMRKDTAEIWASGNTYGVDDRAVYASGVYECDTLHNASTWVGDAAYWTSVTANDAFWVGASGDLAMTFELDPDDYIEMQAPNYTAIS